TGCRMNFLSRSGSPSVFDVALFAQRSPLQVAADAAPAVGPVATIAQSAAMRMVLPKLIGRLPFDLKQARIRRRRRDLNWAQLRNCWRDPGPEKGQGFSTACPQGGLASPVCHAFPVFLQTLVKTVPNAPCVFKLRATHGANRRAAGWHRSLLK